MGEEKKQSLDLRQRAEGQMRKEAVAPEQSAEISSPEEMAKIIHELRVHQIELKMQNEELRRIQAELEVARDQYSHLYDFAPVGYLTINDKGTIVGANLTFTTQVGMERSAVVGKLFSRFIHREDQDIYYRRNQTLLTSGSCQPFRIRLIKNDGTDFYTNLDCIILEENDNTRKQIRIVVSDITEQKELEWRLWQAQKMESIAKLAGGIAHQFNNALFVITGNSELLKMQEPDNEKTLEYIGSIRHSASRMAKWTRQLLAYARGGKYQLQEISMSVLVRNTLELLQHELDPSIRVETKLPGTIYKTSGDLGQLVMVFSVILSNASEAIKQDGHIKIICRNKRLKKEDIKDFPGLKPGPYVTLIVEDDGSGMDEETRKQVFEPFFTTKFLGRGLGLSAAYGIVKNHGGWISVESQVNHGTIATVYLPAVSEDDEKSGKPIQKDPAQNAETILVIEDDLMVIEVLRKMLEKLGYFVLKAQTGKKAVHIAKAYDGDIDLAILDVFLPDMNGNEIYPMLKKFRPNLKVIVCSGYSIEGPAQAILNAGAQDFIQKPVQFKNLSAKLNAILHAKNYKP